MKNLKLIMLFCIGALFIASKSFGQANPFINVLPANSGIVSVGATLDIVVTIGNTGPISSVPQAKLRPIIQVPPSVVFLSNAQQVGLPAGWTILSNTGSQLRVCNSTDPIPVSTSRTIILKVQGVAVTPPQTFSGNINFGNGTTCAAGTSVSGDLTTDNSATSTIEVVAPAATISTTSIPNACNGQQTAQINATQTGLTGTLTWSLNPTVGVNNNNGTFEDLSGGTYTVSVSNGSASTSTVVTLIDPPVFSNTMTSLVPLLCNNVASGSVTITSTGGTPYSGAPGPYIVELWQGTPSSGTQLKDTSSAGISTFSSLGAGQYFVRCEDFNACIDTIFNITLANPTAISFSANATQINCSGGTGSVALVGTGGTGSLTYLQGTTSVTSPITGLAAGAYTFTATDANGCASSLTLIMTEPIAVTVAVSSTNVNCNGAANGTITANGSVGSTITVNGTALVNPYAPGIYTVVASAANANGNGSCTASTTVTITEPMALVATSVGTGINCFNGKDTITVSATGGTLPYTGIGTFFAFAGSTNYIVMDSNGCASSTSIISTQPSFPVSVIASISNASCTSIFGTINVITSGGTGTITHTINGLTDTVNYPVGTYAILATDANGCAVTTVANIGSDGTPITINANASVSTFCTGTLVTLWGSPNTNASGTPLTFTWTDGIIDSMLFVYSGASTYTVIATDGNCFATSSINISPTLTASQAIAQATTLNATSIAGSSCDNSLQPDSSTINYVNSSCGLIATVTDSAGGNSLGNVSACVTVSANVMLAGTQPYVPRVFTITPQNQGPAQVTLFYTNDDFLDYNANSNGYPLFATAPTVSLANNYTMTVCITQYSAIDSTTFSATATWDSVTQKWIVSFPVTNFSTFFCHTCNPNNVPLGIHYLTLNGRREGPTNIIDWSTLKEENNNYFNLLRGATPTSLTVLAAKIKTKAINGNSATKLQYNFTDVSPLLGHNYYKIEQYDLNNHVTNSEVIDIYWSLDGTQVVVYPNPANSKLNIDVNIDRNSSAKMRIYDVTGKLVKQIETELKKGTNNTSIDLGEISAGIYMVRISDGKGLNFSQQFNKQ
jgi:hypothetical protein